MNKRSKGILIFMLVFISTFALVSSSRAATVVVDGDPSDWPENSEVCIAGTAGCPRLLDDTDEAAIPDKFDIKAIYFTNDAANFYFRFDTQGSTDYSTDQVVIICFDIDENAATGFGIPDCEGAATGVMDGVDYIVLLQSIGGIPNPFLFLCNPGCAPTGATVNIGNANATTEIGIALADLGLPAGCASGCPFRAGIYFDNQQLPPDDAGPNANSFVTEVGFSSLGDYVWFDTDADGMQDGGEAGIPGVTVELYDIGGFRMATTVTGASGDYVFTDLQAGNYKVRVDWTTLPVPYAQTFDLDGNLDDETFVYLAYDIDYLTVDFGYTTAAVIGDTVWFDQNGNGSQDGGEPGIAGVTLTLLGENDGVPSSFPDEVQTTTTDENGNYAFGRLQPGDYTVTVEIATLPGGMTQTYDLDLTLDDETVVTLTLGETNNNLDYGYTASGSIGDRVWYDANSDGVQDGGESGVNGVTVNLSGDFDGDGDEDYAASTTTSGDGDYSFTNLPAGDYTVTVVSGSLPGGYTPTYDADGIATAHTSELTLGAGATDDTQDFGYDSSGSIGDRVWLDHNSDTFQDTLEPGFPNLEILLKDSGGTVIATTLTDSNGNYNFTNLAAGTYTVVVSDTMLLPGAKETYDVDGHIATPHEATVTITDGEVREDVDFGYELGGVCIARHTIGDTIWRDDDANSAQNGGEPGVAGVTVNLKDSGGSVIATTTTNVDGFYAFVGLNDGDYTVEVDDTTLGAGYIATYDLDGIETLNTADVTLDGDSNLDVDFGYRWVGELGDYVWDDANGDGVQDGSETGISGVTVFLKDSGGTILDTDVTDTNGLYLFTGLPNATYTVEIDDNTLPAGFGPTWDYDGLPLSPHKADVTITSNQNYEVDFGYQLGAPPVCTVPLDVDFTTDAAGNAIPMGAFIDDEYAAWGITFTTNDVVNHNLMAFDTANPTGGDDDLGAPNEDFGGPGKGTGGEAGQPGENSQPLGNVLIISEDMDQSDPDDNGGGGTITINFTTLTDVITLKILDIEEQNSNEITIYDTLDNVLFYRDIAGLGNNSYEEVSIDVAGASYLTIDFSGSGSVSGFNFCQE